MNRLRLGLDQRPEDVDLADIVNQSEQYPLYIHFTFGAQGEAVHMFMHTDVGKDRFYYAQSSGIDFLSLLAVDLGFHQIDQVRLGGIDLEEKGESFTKFLSKIPKKLTDEPSSQHRR